MNDVDLLALHREIVAIPSISGSEGALATHISKRLESLGIKVNREGDNLWAALGKGRSVCLNSHIDTVPAASGWTRSPHDVTVEAGRIFGLGANDAKASVASMLAAFVRLYPRAESLGVRLLLTLVASEETAGKGCEVLVPELRRQGAWPDCVVVGEPTGLDIAVAQKGLLVLELVERGQACHAAHARALGIENPWRSLARDLLALDAVDFGNPDPELGPLTLEPTVGSSGTARNMVPGEVRCLLDVRVNPEPSPDVVVERVRRSVKGEVVVVSQRLRPCRTDKNAEIVRAATMARPASKHFGSRGVSDWVHFADVPAIKVGPGQSERSHTADEFVFEQEVIEGAKFYEDLVLAYAGIVKGSR